MKADRIRRALWLIVLLLWCQGLLAVLERRSQASALKGDTCEQQSFREQKLTRELYTKLRREYTDNREFADALTATMLGGSFRPVKITDDGALYRKYKPQEYALLQKCYQAVWADVTYFPIPDRNIYYENSFMEPRDYGGKRAHEGTDLFGKVKKAGYYPVLSMTAGVVENIGWLPLGGYRIGIRAPSGGYFYYAHLSEYEREFETGDEIDAGEILGFMGNTGYGYEGTYGKFPVHLHLGIYIETPHYEELSVNPYYILKAVSKKIRNYSY